MFKSQRALRDRGVSLTIGGVLVVEPDVTGVCQWHVIQATKSAPR